MSILIKDIGLSKRTVNSLSAMDVYTIDDWEELRKEYKTLTIFRGISDNTVTNIKSAVRKAKQSKQD